MVDLLNGHFRTLVRALFSFNSFLGSYIASIVLNDLTKLEKLKNDIKNEVE